MTDRICIHSNGQKKPRLGAEDLVSCCASCSDGDGCEGAKYLITAWKFYETQGIVSGGSYEHKTGCRPYSFPICSHFDIDTPGVQKCPDETMRAPKCVKQCQPSYNKKYREDKHYGDYFQSKW
ncbi:UNVERIFIED_CONTAM: hypothetical protein GTU68_028851 [Idotea baltica]|nr:hypothetical protein [Idotea baltica]